MLQLKGMFSRRRFLKSSVGIALAGSALLGLGIAGVYRFWVSRHSVPLRGLVRPLRVLQLSDLHFGPWIHAKSVRKWVNAALEQRPELILITGDILDTESHTQSWRSRIKQGLSTDETGLFAELKRLNAPLGVWAVWGNHDYSSPEALRLLEANLNKLGIQVLTNRGALLRPDLFLAGVDDLWYGEPDAPKAISTVPDAVACLLMCHNPDYLFKVPARVDLTFCGHTHGGQVALPLLGSPWTPSQYGSRFISGWIQEPRPAFVSRGLGVTGVPLRNVQAEMTVFDFTPREA